MKLKYILKDTGTHQNSLCYYEKNGIDQRTLILYYNTQIADY